ncbi:peptidylprolyl isomerase [Roseovarius sp. M141]|uniref:peptidylprolyl isomerase n=1 Tax=Roseovarius sp. M141 TaxID=2583806 RepID=UPI0020CFA00B|nr:peptidylprolyl isomerase [Roseovarius sp. M141]MCQ0092907.1 peptidylprolyl isomerase [Roseovarius sp. M141]
MRSSRISKSAMWILMGLLVLGLAGFSVTNFSGGITQVGSVGETAIDVNEYARALRAEVNAATAETGAPVSFAQAEAEGLPQNVLSRLIAQAALEDETARLGISVGDATLLQQITEIPGFQGLDGNFDRDGYRYALDRAGFSEAEFEEDIRTETASTLVQGAIISGVSTPDAYIDTLLNYIAEERSVTYAPLARADLTTGMPVPSDADLEAYYQSNLPAFTTPQIKRITYAWMTPEMIIDDVEVPQDALREAYDSRIAEFEQPERRLVERLVFPDADAAATAMAQIDSGEASFDDLVAARGLSLQDVDLGDVERDDLNGAGEAVFDAGAGDVVGPLDSNLGPALFRVNAVLQAQSTSFEEAEPQLRDELAGDRAARVVDAATDTIDDLLAGGATLENLKDETNMQVGVIDWHPGLGEGIAGYTEFRSAAEAVADGDFPAVAALGDGGIFALRLDEVIDPTVQPISEVQDQVAAAWARDALLDALSEQAAPMVEAIENGASFEDQGLTPQTAAGLTRQGFQQGTPPGFIPALFDMQEGDVMTIPGTTDLFIVRLDAIESPDATPDATDGDLVQMRQTLRDSAANDIAQDLYQALAGDIRSRAGITLDQQAINAVHANFQ